MQCESEEHKVLAGAKAYLERAIEMYKGGCPQTLGVSSDAQAAGGTPALQSLTRRLFAHHSRMPRLKD